MSDLDSLQARLHYSFKNASLLEEALTAAGAAVSSRDVDGPASGNKRLALVGDAVLRLSVLDEWYPAGGSTGKSEISRRA
jgi:ribonuclease-3